MAVTQALVVDSIEAATPEPHRTVFIGNEGDDADE